MPKTIVCSHNLILCLEFTQVIRETVWSHLSISHTTQLRIFTFQHAHIYACLHVCALTFTSVVCASVCVCMRTCVCLCAQWPACTCSCTRCVYVSVHARVCAFCQPRGHFLSLARRCSHHWTDGQHPPSLLHHPFIYPSFYPSITVFLSCSPPKHLITSIPRSPPPSIPLSLSPITPLP